MDGFIAKENGDISWLDELSIDMAETGYDDFFAAHKLEDLSTEKTEIFLKKGFRQMEIDLCVDQGT